LAKYRRPEEEGRKSREEFRVAEREKEEEKE
jgi:hypothetical protein